MKKILITGATGFIGRHLYRRLKDLKYDVMGISFEGGEISGDKITSLDITNEAAVKKFFDGKKFDTVFHLAAIKSDTRSDNLETTKRFNLINGIGTLNILKKLSKKNNCRIIYSSTIEIYGSSDTPVLISESAVPRPKSFYAISKLLGEYYCEKYFDDFQVPYICLRLASVYGSCQPVSSLLPIIIEKAMNNEDIIVYGQGMGFFDFIFIDDAISAFLVAGISLEVGIFNIGSGTVISVKELCEKVKKVWFSQSEIIFDNTKRENCYNIQLDITKAKQKLNYIPKYSIDKGLAELKTK